MLNDSQEAAHLLQKVKVELNVLFHSEITMYDKFIQMYKEEPPTRVKEFLTEIGVPIDKLNQIFCLIKYITQSMKEILDMHDPWSTNTYLNTSKDFE